VKAARRETPCDCIGTVTKELAKQHLELVLAFKSNKLVLPIVETQKTMGAPRGARNATLVATFCPFCGKRFPRAAKVSP